jgi:hypothetical protein
MSLNKFAGILLTVWKLVICITVIVGVLVCVEFVFDIVNDEMLKATAVLIFYASYVTAILFWKRSAWRDMRKAVEEWIVQNVLDWYGDE